jgi:acyl carrier protein
MNRDEILATLIRIGGDVVPDFRHRRLEGNMSYREVGINSMDLMEILVMAMKELNIKISNDQLSEVNSFDGLVDLFTKASGGKG